MQVTSIFGGVFELKLPIECKRSLLVRVAHQRAILGMCCGLQVLTVAVPPSSVIQKEMARNQQRLLPEGILQEMQSKKSRISYCDKLEALESSRVCAWPGITHLSCESQEGSFQYLG